MGRVESVNVAQPATLERRGRKLSTGIFKEPVAGPVAITAEGVEGDHVVDRRVHGGTDKAVYAYAREDTDWWESELGRDLPDGTFGENLSVSGIDLNAAELGERWRVGGALLEVSEPRFPCWKLQQKLGVPLMIKRFAQAHRSGTYLRVIEPGAVSTGDEVTVESRPGHGVTIGAVFEDRVG